jgi:hypothetical protein
MNPLFRRATAGVAFLLISGALGAAQASAGATATLADKVAKVTVVGTDDKVARIDDKVAGTDDKVAGTDDKVAGTDDKVAGTDDKVA